MKRATLTLASLVFTGTAIAQDLPPGVLLLARVKSHINTELRRLATISCLETVEREHQPPKGKMRPLDTVRLEVLTDGFKELFASPGDRRFSENPPISYAGSGTLGNGLFGTYLRNILLGEAVSSVYQGEEEVRGRRLARYDYRVAAMFSGQRITTLEGSGEVGLRGSYWVDPQTYDVARLELRADSIPATLPVTEMTTSIDYAPRHLTNDMAVLLPESAEFRLVRRSGEISHNRVGFTQCRVFGAESTIHFSPADSAPKAASVPVASLDETPLLLPGGLQIAVKLRSRLSEDMAVGTLIDGVIAEDVETKHSTLIPAGALVRGRIRRLEHYTDPIPFFVVGLEFIEVEVRGVRYRFDADLVEIDSAPGVELTLSATTGTETPMSRGLHRDIAIGKTDVPTGQTEETMGLYNLPGVAAFFFKGTKLELPQDFRTVWKTRPQKP